MGRDGTIYLLRPHEYSEPKGFSLVATGPVQQWEVRPEGGICNIPVVADDGTVIFGTRKDVSWAVSPEGKKKWTYSFPPASFHPPIEHSAAYPKASGSPSCSQPAVATDGTSYWIGHGVYALSSGGILRWKSESEEDFVSVCVGVDGTIYALANGGLIAIMPEGRDAGNWQLMRPSTSRATSHLGMTEASMCQRF